MLLNFFPFPVGHPPHLPCSYRIVHMGKPRFGGFSGKFDLFMKSLLKRVKGASSVVLELQILLNQVHDLTKQLFTSLYGFT